MIPLVLDPSGQTAHFREAVCAVLCCAVLLLRVIFVCFNLTPPPVSAGNMVEWCLPQDIDLEGVEFKSMASGSHKVQSDFM